MAYDTSELGDSTEDETNIEANRVPEKVAIEDDLPLTAVDIESQKDMKSGRYHAIRGFSKWFAARPSPAVRLAILGSIYPAKQLTDDKLLKLMQVGPKQLDSDIADYVRKKYDEDRSSSDNLDEHYDYPNPNTQNPSQSQIDTIKSDIIDEWGDELPTILDPTAGRGIIPFESIRYGISTVSNELDPVPFSINKIALELAPEIGPTDEDYGKWEEKILQRTTERVSRFFPTKKDERQILNYATTYIITCDSCGGETPLVGKWWLNRTSNGGHAIRPTYEDGKVNYEHIKTEDNSEFDPSDAPIARGGDVECPHCGVTTDAERIREKFQDDAFEYSVYGVNYETQTGEWAYRAGDEIDIKGLDKARKRADSFELMDFFAEEISPGYNKNQIKRFGLDEWRDVFTPRQLVTHYELFEVIEEIKNEIRAEYGDKKAKLLISLTVQVVNRQLQYNNRLAQWNEWRGCPSYVFSNQNYSIKRMFVENNIIADRRGIRRTFDHVFDNYNELASQAVESDGQAELYNTDATRLSEEVNNDSIELAVVDPPYFDSVMYGEMSDFMHLTIGELLDDTLDTVTKNKSNAKQMVVNNIRHDDGEAFYESMMNSMFAELRNILVEDGVLTLMFTDRETKAWNTILKSLIQSGFTITASHPVKTEGSDKIGMHDAARVESSIFVTARNTQTGTNTSAWEDVRDKVASIARKEAQRLLSVDTINKIDTSIEAFGAALEAYSNAYPVEDKYGDNVYPGRVLTIVRNEVYSIIANDELSTETDQLDGISRWYILSNVLYDDADIPFDEANQLGIGADIDINEIKTSTKIWSKSSGDVSLNDHTDRVQDIIKLRDSNAENPSTRKYPVDPTDNSFTYTIDAVHAVLHVYEKEGQKPTRDWLAQRELKSDQQFKKAIKALLEATPEDSQMRGTLQDIIAGETGNYLDISVRELNVGGANDDRQSGIEEYKS